MSAPQHIRYRRVLAVSPEIADLIATVCPDEPCYRAPDAPEQPEEHYAPDAQVPVWPNAEMIHDDEKRSASYGRRKVQNAAWRRRRTRENQPAKYERLSRHMLAVLAECGPMPLREAEIRMRRRCLAASQEVGATLRHLVEDGRVRWAALRIESGATMTVYEVAT